MPVIARNGQVKVFARRREGFHKCAAAGLRTQRVVCRKNELPEQPQDDNETDQRPENVIVLGQKDGEAAGTRVLRPSAQEL